MNTPIQNDISESLSSRKFSDYSFAREIIMCTPIWLNVFKWIWKYIIARDDFDIIRAKLLDNSEVLMTHIFVLDSVYKIWDISFERWRSEEDMIYNKFVEMDLVYIYSDIINIIESIFWRTKQIPFKQRVLNILDNEGNNELNIN